MRVIPELKPVEYRRGGASFEATFSQLSGESLNCSKTLGDLMRSWFGQRILTPDLRREFEGMLPAPMIKAAVRRGD
jgi:hypothetical protein